MKRPERDFLFFIEDIIDSIEKIERYTHELDFNGFESNEMIVDAVIRNLEIIGEASNKVPENIRDKYTEIPWNEMYRMRNRAIHEYFGIDYEIIWSIIKEYLPKNHTDLLNAFHSEGGVRK